MKRYIIVAVLLAVALVAPTVVGAQAPETLPGSGWWTGQTIMNVGTADATIVSTAYDKSSSATYMASAGPIAPGGSITFLPTDFSGMPNGFQGSAVVASDQQIKAIVTLTNRSVPPMGIAGGAAIGQYQGMDGTAAATTLRFPLVKQNWINKSTTLYVQNAGATAATAAVVYTCGANSYNDTTPSIGPGQMAVLTPATVVPNSNLCSATVTSGQPLAGVAVETWTTETVATLAQVSRAFTQADYSHTAYAPMYKKKYPLHPTQGRSTGAQIQNVTSGSINITATYYGSGGTCPAPATYTETQNNVPAGGSWTFLKPASMPDGCIASAKFVGTGDIVGVVNEAYLDPVAAQGFQSATAYNTSSDTSSTIKAVAPVYKEKFGGKSTGLQVQNVGSSTATVHVVFKAGATTTWTTIDQTVSPGASLNYFLISDQPGLFQGTPMPPGQFTSATIYSTQPILANSVETPFPLCFGQGATPCYDKANAEGFNLAP